MAGHKETPRQKMIGMMYLVLTALLALNVSSDLLNAFVIVNEAMDKTNVNFRDKADDLYVDFEEQYKLKPDKVKEWWDKAQEVKKASGELIKQIQSVQNMVIGYTEYGDRNKKSEVTYKAKNVKGEEETKKASEPRLVPLSSIVKRDNFDLPMEILLNLKSSENGTAGEATKIKNAILKYKEKIADILDSTPQQKAARIKSLGINLDERYNPNANKTQNWEMSNFANSPLAADMILLNKLIADVQNIEVEAIKQLKTNITADDFKFDNLTAAVVPTSGTVLVTGQPYEANIFIAANSSTDKPEVYVGSTKITNIENGVAKYKVNTGAQGEQKYAGVIKVTKDDGTTTDYSFSSSYMVIRPTATVSADKMNVVYKGLDNPLSVSAPGFTNDKLTLTSSGGGALKGGNGKYMFNPTQATGEVKFSVIGKSSDGKTTNLGSFVYRIKPVPSPTTRISGTADGGTLDRARLAATPDVTSMLEGFLFDLPPFKVTSFELQVTNPKRNPLYESITGSKLNETVLAKIRAFPPGSRIMISNVKVIGPSGPGRATTISIVLN